MTATRVRDFIAYLGIALSLCVLAILFAERNFDTKWFFLVFETAITFGCAVGWNRHLWPLPVFWILILLLFAAHLLAFIILLQRIEQWRPWAVAPVWVVETFLVQALIVLSTPAFARHRRKRRKMPKT